jgi:ribosome-associated translation inhibitor RaiA
LIIMAQRGLQRKPDSRRGLVANGGVIPEPIQEEITAPAGLPDHVLRLFDRLVRQNRAAGVSIRQVDADLYADLAGCMIRAADAADDMFLKLGKQINELRSQLNMGPRNRQRAGIKDTKKPEAKSAQLAIIDRAKQHPMV